MRHTARPIALIAPLFSRRRAPGQEPGVTGDTSLARAWRSPSLRLWLCGLVMAAAYFFVFAVRFPLTKYYDGLTDIGAITGYSRQAAGAYSACILVLFAGYLIAWRGARGLPYKQARCPVYAMALLFGVIAFSLYPITAIDTYVYLAWGRVWAYYGANPFLVAPASFPQDPLTAFTGCWADDTTPYGPLWTWLSAIPGLVAGKDLLAGLLLMKALALASYLGAGLAISHALSSVDGSIRAPGLLLFLWNPLIVLEVVGNAHNDGVMVFLALLAVALIVSRRPLAGFLALTLSVLTKYATVLVAPVFLLHALANVPGWRRRARLVAMVAVSCAALAALLTAPFWAGKEMLSVFWPREMPGSTVPASYLYTAARSLFPAHAADVFRWGRLAAVGLFCLWQLWATYRRPRHWLAASFEVLFFVLFLGNTFYSWYLVWPLAFAFFTEKDYIPERAILFSFLALLSVSLYGYVGVWWGWKVTQSSRLALPIICLPPLLLSLWAWLRPVLRRSGRQKA